MSDVFTSRAVSITPKTAVTWKQRVLKLKAMDVRLLRIELIKCGTYPAKINLFSISNRNIRKWCEYV